jgi:hypothetical protein
MAPKPAVLIVRLPSSECTGPYDNGSNSYNDARHACGKKRRRASSSQDGDAEHINRQEDSSIAEKSQSVKLIVLVLPIISAYLPGRNVVFRGALQQKLANKSLTNIGRRGALESAS